MTTTRRERPQNGSSELVAKRVTCAASKQLAEKFRPALALLLESSEYAAQTSGIRWEYAIEIQQLRATGLLPNDLRWLVRMGLVEHARELTLPGQDGRQFQPTGDLTFTSRTCFVLTSTGVITASAVCHTDASAPNTSTTHNQVERGIASNRPRPTWDAEQRVLCFDGKIVKRFKWHAINQEAILGAFQEEGWPRRIDDPLAPHAEQDSKRRLSDTIKCLNRKQQNSLMHFRGDGTGEGVIWEIVNRDGPNGKSP